MDAASDDSLSNDDDSTKKRRDILTRRPSYRKILNDLGGGEIAGNISAYRYSILLECYQMCFTVCVEGTAVLRCFICQ